LRVDDCNVIICRWRSDSDQTFRQNGRRDPQFPGWVFRRGIGIVFPITIESYDMPNNLNICAARSRTRKEQAADKQRRLPCYQKGWITGRGGGGGIWERMGGSSVDHRRSYA